MSNDTLDAIQRELKLRKIRRDGQDLLKGRELHDFLSIKEKHDRDRDATEALYREEYKVRVDVAYRVLLKKAGSLRPDLKPKFFGVDRFNTAKMNRDAQRLTRFEHERTMARLDVRELKESTSFLEKCSERRRYLESFAEAAKRGAPLPSRASQTRSSKPSMSD